MKLGLDTSEIINQLSPTENASPLDKILSVLAPDCQANKISLKNINCMQFSQGISYKSFEKLFRKHSLESINQGQAIGLSICSKIFENPHSTFNNCIDNGHGVTLTGYRCDQGFFN